MSNKKLAPLAKDWRWRKFGDCVRLINGRAYSQEELLDSGTPVLRIQNLNGGDRWYYSNLSLPDEKYCDAGDLLYAWSASFGPYRFAGPKSIFHYHIWRVLPGEDLDKNFAFRLLEWITTKIQAAAHGVAMLHMTKAGMEAWLVPVPPISEQRRIAEILDKADALRAKRRAALDHLDTLNQSLFHNMFGDPETILKRWPTRKLGELLDYLTSGSRGWAGHYAETGALFIRIQNVHRDELLLEDVAYVNAPDTAEAKRTRVESNDVLLSITADLGRTAVVPDGLGPAFINQHLSILRTKALAPRFLSAYLTSPAGQRQILRRNRQGVKAGLNFDDIRSFIAPIPPAKLQRDFVSYVTAAERLKTINRASLTELSVFFSALQHRAFRGEL